MTYTKKNAKKIKDDASALLVFGTMDQATKCGKSQKKYAKILKNKKRKIKNKFIYCLVNFFCYFLFYQLILWHKFFKISFIGYF